MSGIGDNNIDKVSQIANAFNSLQTKQARLAALDRILDLLQLDEWREVNARAVPLQRDVVGCLPLEIVVEITRYLEPRDILRFQRVSKRWKTILSSDAVYRPVLRFHFVPETETTLSTGGFRSLLERKHRLEIGSPFSEAFYPWLNGPDFSSDRKALNLVSYCYGKVAWVSRDRRRIFVRDLQLGTIAEFVPETRGIISLVHVSDPLLCVEASGYLTTWDLATKHSISARLPSSNVLEINTQGNNAAIILQSQRNQHILLSWHFQTGSLRLTYFDGQPLFTCWDENATTITVIVLDKTEPSDAYRFFRRRFSTSEDTITPLESKLLATMPPGLNLSERFSNASRYSQFLTRYETTVSQILPSGPPDDVKDNIYISYCARFDKLTVLTFEDVRSIYNDKKTHPGVDLYLGRLLSPDGIIYYPGPLSCRVGIENIFKQQNFITDKRLTARGGAWFQLSIPFGNHQLFGVVGQKGIAVWSFDPELHLYPRTELEE